MKRIGAALLAFACAASAAGSTACTSDEGDACTATVSPGSDDQTSIQGALQNAKSGDTICFTGGRFKLTDELTLNASGVTLRGQSDTVLDFSGQKGGANGLHVQANDTVVDTLQLVDVKGDGVRADEADGITMRNVRVAWSTLHATQNGPYGLYPVQSKRVLIENCDVSGASDACVYVGQSEQISVHDNRVHDCVAGIEIENSTNAEVFANDSHDNVGGILVFALPGLPVKTSGTAWVHDNEVHDNNTPTFAAAGNIVHLVPQGTGVLVLASDHNEISHNHIHDNDSVGLTILSWKITMMASMDATYDEYPEGNFVHDNALSNDGTMPHDIAAQLTAIIGSSTIPELTWDGEVDALKTNTDGSLTNCFKDNGSASFLDFDYAHLGSMRSTDIGPYTCTHPALSPVSTSGFPGEP